MLGAWCTRELSSSLSQRIKGQESPWASETTEVEPQDEPGLIKRRGWEVPRSAVSKLETQESQWCSSSLSPKAWESGELMVKLLVWVWRAENQESQWCSSSLKTSRPETQKELMFPFESKDNKNSMSQFKGSQAGGIVSYLPEGQPFWSTQMFNWLDGAHPH